MCVCVCVCVCLCLCLCQKQDLAVNNQLGLVFQKIQPTNLFFLYPIASIVFCTAANL